MDATGDFTQTSFVDGWNSNLAAHSARIAGSFVPQHGLIPIEYFFLRYVLNLLRKLKKSVEFVRE